MRIPRLILGEADELRQVNKPFIKAGSATWAIIERGIWTRAASEGVDGDLARWELV